jgi:hypothetical protein
MADPGTDPLSPLVHQIIDSASYEKLTVSGPIPAKARELLGGVTPDQLLTVPITSDVHAYAMLAGLWLWHDALDECHQIAQMEPHGIPHGKISTSLNVRFMESVENDNRIKGCKLDEAAVSLSFWHAIMHRREGDFSNAKYWYARCTNHPVLQTMTLFVNDILHPLPADKSYLRLTQGGWNPNAFVDLAEELHRRPADPRLGVAVALQKLEWRLLFDHCTRAAAGQ